MTTAPVQPAHAVGHPHHNTDPGNPGWRSLEPELTIPRQEDPKALSSYVKRQLADLLDPERRRTHGLLPLPKKKPAFTLIASK